jgi:hypothetical protein
MGWTNDQTQSITVPPQGGPQRIVIGPDDPFAVAAGAVAAIMFYWQDDEAFMLDVLFDGANTGQLRLSNTDATGIVAQYWNAFYNEDTGAQNLTLGSGDDHATTIDIDLGTGGGDFTVDAISQGRNRRHAVSITANSAAIGTTETVVLTLPASTFTLLGGRAYALNVGGRTQGSVANSGLFRVRLGTTTGGALLLTYGAVPVQTAGATGAPNVTMTRYAIRDPGDGDYTGAVVLTLQSSTGTTTMLAGGNEPFYLEFLDVGTTDDFFDQGVFI